MVFQRRVICQLLADGFIAQWGSIRARYPPPPQFISGGACPPRRTGFFQLIDRSAPPPDVRLVELVRQLGTKSWTLVAARLGGGRNGKQCRERWHNHLDPDVKKGPWTEDEDAVIIAHRPEGVAPALEPLVVALDATLDALAAAAAAAPPSRASRRNKPGLHPDLLAPLFGQL